MGYQIDADGTIIRPGGEEEHALIVTSVTNGTISLSASSEKAGKTIYIYDNQNDGYKLAGFSYSSKYGVINLGKNHSFIMPDTDVGVSASFVKKKTSDGNVWKIILGVIFVLAVAFGIMKLTSPNNEKVTKFMVNGVPFNMIKVEGGSFSMGATYEQGSEAMWWEEPVHQVSLNSYYIGETEVTQALWKAVVGENPSSFKGDNLPVDCVSWDDCVEFCRLLSQKTGKRFRLPTEAEWEFAARGGNNSNHYKYPGSDYVYEVAWCIGVSDSIPHPVKTKKPNELGIYDMAGNAWEWCNDYWCEKYYDYSQVNPQGPSDGEYRVHRGGGWLNHPTNCRISYRYKAKQSRRNDFRGFRLAMDY